MKHIVSAAGMLTDGSIYLPSRGLRGRKREKCRGPTALFWLLYVR